MTEYAKALNAIATSTDACNCVRVHSWYGEGHNSECPVAIAAFALGGGKHGIRRRVRIAKKMLGDIA